MAIRAAEKINRSRAELRLAGLPTRKGIDKSARVHAKDHLRLEDQLDWINGIAKKVAGKYHIHNSTDIEEVYGDCVLKMVELAQQFYLEPGNTDYVGAFRGWTYLTINKEAERSCERVLNAGTYRTRRQLAGQKLIVAVPTSQMTTATGDKIELPCNRQAIGRDLDRKPGTLLQRMGLARVAMAA
jgi:hypothetical protein